jgi:hypothetical protein
MLGNYRMAAQPVAAIVMLGSTKLVLIHFRQIIVQSDT